MLRAAALVAFLAPVLDAQTTWIVDALGGAGSTHTTIQAAVIAAQDGDVVLVRPTATYNWSLAMAKSLTILGSGTSPTLATGTFDVQGTRTDQQVVIGNFNVTNGAGTGFCLNAISLGRVIVTGVSFSTSRPGTSHVPTINASGGGHLAIQNSNLTGGFGMWLTANSKLTASATGFYGQTGCGGLSAVDSRIEATNCTFTGGGEVSPIPVPPGVPPQAGIVMLRCVAFVAGGQSTGGPATYFQTPRGIAMSASTLSIDSTTQIVPPIINAPLPSVIERGRVTGNLAPRGNNSWFVYEGPASSIGVLAVSFPGPAQSMSYGTAWLDPATVSVLGIRLMPVIGQVPVPSSAMQGTAITFQGLLLYQGVLRFSPPLLDAVR